MPRWRLSKLVTVFGGLALAFALLSIVDILLPRPYDGVVLEADQWGILSVREVVAGSGADLAGIQPGDRIAGIDRTVLASSAHASRLLARHQIGDEVPYLLRRANGLEEVRVHLGRRFIGSAPYFYACLLGFAFFAVALFVRRRQPELRAAQIFYLVGALFLLFLVCRLRPASYGWIDNLVLEAGALALLLLPACFLHFFLVFPRPISLRPAIGDPDFKRRRRRWLLLLTSLYVLPPVVFLVAIGLWRHAGVTPRLITGAPEASWWVLGAYILVGLATLAWNARATRDPRQRRGIALVFAGSLFGLLPFLGLAVARPAWLYSEPQAFALLLPLTLVPLTFAFAIIRFGLLDIRVMVRRSLVYSIVTVGVAAVYSIALALVNAFALGSQFSASRAFPILFALGVLLLLEPLRHRLQAMIDRFVHADRRRLEEAIRKLGRAIAAEIDPRPVVRDVVERLPKILGLHFAALYLERDGELERAAGAEHLPARLPLLAPLHDALAAKGEPVPLAEIARLVPDSSAVRELALLLEPTGVEIVGDLTSPRRKIGLVLLSGTTGQIEIGDEVRTLLGSLFGQAALAIETSRLVAERTQQAELERELEIASSVQAELLPRVLHFGEGWSVAAVCRAARHVGGDFYTELPAGLNGNRAIVFGDVAGKSVAGALVMMAAHEALQTLALSHRDPETLFALANRRLYGLGTKKSFVALGWVAASDDGEGIDYLLAGQPQLLVRSASGGVRELPLPPHRLPLGALLDGRYVASRAAVSPGDVILGYSDGVTEAQAPDGELFGDDRLIRVLAGADGGPHEIIRQILAAIAAFTRGADPYDDITLVAISRDGGGEICTAAH
ncbi:MAG: SpoIIE family protein phosphatase [Thermoanaerobaculia bacterium]